MEASANDTARKAVLSCLVFKSIFDELNVSEFGIHIEYLPEDFHRHPQEMLAATQVAVDRVSRGGLGVVLAAGLCSNGTVGLRAPSGGLVIPRANDCIPLFMGSNDLFRRQFASNPGTYYLSRGWLARGMDPLRLFIDEYVPRVGAGNAEWAIHEEFKHYSDVVLITMDNEDDEDARQAAEANALFLKKNYREVIGSRRYLEQLVFGPWPSEDFIALNGGETVAADMFWRD